VDVKPSVQQLKGAQEELAAKVIVGTKVVRLVALGTSRLTVLLAASTIPVTAGVNPSNLKVIISLPVVGAGLVTVTTQSWFLASLVNA